MQIYHNGRFGKFLVVLDDFSMARINCPVSYTCSGSTFINFFFFFFFFLLLFFLTFKANLRTFKIKQTPPNWISKNPTNNSYESNHMVHMIFNMQISKSTLEKALAQTASKFHASYMPNFKTSWNGKATTLQAYKAYHTRLASLLKKIY